MQEIGRYPGNRTSRPARETKLMDRFPMPAEPSLSLGMFHVEHWSNRPTWYRGWRGHPGPALMFHVEHFSCARVRQDEVR